MSMVKVYENKDFIILGSARKGDDAYVLYNREKNLLMVTPT